MDKRTKISLVLNIVSILLSTLGCFLAYKRGYKAAEKKYQGYVDYFEDKSSKEKVSKDEILGKVD